VIRPLAIIGLLLIPLPAIAQDGDEAFCKARFVPCVQATGRPMQCQSIYATCMDNVPITDIPPGVSGRIEITMRNGLPTAQLSLTNDSGTEFVTGYHRGEVICGDGSRETVTFHGFGALGLGEQGISGTSVVCHGKPGVPTPVQFGPTPIESGPLDSGVYVNCAADGSRKVTLDRVESDKGLVGFRYQADGYSGFARIDQGIDTVIDMMCTPPADPGFNIINSIYGELIEYFPETFRCHPSERLRRAEERRAQGMAPDPNDCPGGVFSTGTGFGGGRG
jgi:hypothetical protein